MKEEKENFKQWISNLKIINIPSIKNQKLIQFTTDKFIKEVFEVITNKIIIIFI